MKNKIQVYVKDKLILQDVQVANTPWQRFRGLLGTKVFPVGGGLLIRPCNSIHMFGMQYPLDILFLADDGTVLRTICHLKPMRTAMCHDAFQVLELPINAIEELGFTVGMRLTFCEQKVQCREVDPC